MTGPALLSAGLVLKEGSHGEDVDGPCCLVEAEIVHVLRRPVKSDVDPTICPVIRAMAIGLNDAYPDSPAGDVARTADLGCFVGRLAGTKATPAVEEQRSLLALDWLIRVYTPAWLRLVPVLVADADLLVAAHRIDGLDAAEAVGDIVRAAQSNASAAWSGASSAAESGARSAAWSAAESAALSAALSAAESAARSAAEDVLAPTVTTLRASAIDLLDRMIDVTA